MKIYPEIKHYESINFEPLTSEFIQDLIVNGKHFILLKDDFSTTVGILQGTAINKNYDLLIKRFNYRGAFDFFMHKLFNKDRAERLWRKNLILYNSGLPVPVPLQYIKATFGQKISFFISTVLSDTKKLSDIYRKGILNREEKLNKQIAASIANFHNSGAVHGDLKWPNILVRINNTCKIFFVDLEQSSFSPEFNIKGIYKDLIRFYRFGLQLGAEKWVKEKFFPEYLSIIDNVIKKEINIDSIINKAETEWIKKGRQRFL